MGGEGCGQPAGQCQQSTLLCLPSTPLEQREVSLHRPELQQCRTAAPTCPHLVGHHQRASLQHHLVGGGVLHHSRRQAHACESKVGGSSVRRRSSVCRQGVLCTNLRSPPPCRWCHERVQGKTGGSSSRGSGSGAAPHPRIPCRWCTRRGARCGPRSAAAATWPHLPGKHRGGARQHGGLQRQDACIVQDCRLLQLELDVLPLPALPLLALPLPLPLPGLPLHRQPCCRLLLPLPCCWRMLPPPTATHPCCWPLLAPAAHRHPPGSPMRQACRSPRSFMPSGSTLDTPPTMASSSAFFTSSWP